MRTLSALTSILLLVGPGPAIGLTAAELAKHDSPDDCWIAIEGKAYDVTGYLPKHPAPPSALTKYCGKDATAGWKTKDKGKPHSRAAERLLKRFEKGAMDGS